jgi:hypothetical protein
MTPAAQRLRQRAGAPAGIRVSIHALTPAGLLVDDSPRWCELGAVTFRRAPERQTEIVPEDG